MASAVGARARAAGAQSAAAATTLPFAPGERLVFQARSARFGRVGTAVMRVGGAEVVRGHETWVLEFDLRGRVGPTRIAEHTRSWLDPRRMLALRYEARERSPILSRRQAVDVHPDEQRWEAADGSRGTPPTAAPLDELSFLYFLRTLPLRDGDAYALVRHYDARRNPVRVRVVERRRVAVPAGAFATVRVEMRVKDPERYGGEGVIRLDLTDDTRRVPVRVETSKPVAGAVVLTLQSQGSDAAGTAAATPR